jgi:hypothetical protein
MAALRDPHKIAYQCVREESFEAMFSNLGDFKKQEALRASTPEKKHCSFLCESATACAGLPRQIEDVPAGAVCPNNPFNQDERALLRIELNRRLLAMAIDAHRSMQVNGMNESAPRIEVVLGYAYQRFLEDRQWQKPLNS